jgi:hypothetical protein
MSMSDEPVIKRLTWIIVGGTGFWVPPILLSAIFRWKVSALALNSSSLAGLVLIVLTIVVKRNLTPMWGWVLAGVYMLGPASILIASSFARIPPSKSLPGDWVLDILFCLLPPMTLWMATLNGMIYSVLIGTVALLLLAIVRAK